MSMRDTRSSPARDDGGELRMGLSHCSGRNIWMVIYTMVLEVDNTMLRFEVCAEAVHSCLTRTGEIRY